MSTDFFLFFLTQGNCFFNKKNDTGSLNEETSLKENHSDIFCVSYTIYFVGADLLNVC